MTLRTPQLFGWLLALCPLCLLGAPEAAAQAPQGGAAVVLQTQPEGWGALLPALEEALGAPVRLGNLPPWPGQANHNKLKQAQQRYKQGVDHFLDLKLDPAAQDFEAAAQLYQEQATLHPLDQEPLAGLWRSAFYSAWALLEAGDRRQAREKIAQTLEQHPQAEAEAAVFPPPIRELVEAERRKLQRRRRGRALTLQLSPGALPPVQARVQGVPLPLAEDNAGQAQLLAGPCVLHIGAPGLGLLRYPIAEGDQDLVIKLDLLKQSQSLTRLVRGLPLDKKQRRALSTTASPETLIYFTDASPLQREGVLIYLQEASGALTGAFLLGKHALRLQDAQALADALRSPSLEVVSLSDPQGAWQPDEDLASRLEHVLHPDDGPDPEEDQELGIYLGLALGAGAGRATEVTDPGLAPVPLLLRADLALRLDPDWDLGVAARVQPLQFAALAEPYARWRLGLLRLRAGLMLGQITHQIVHTENRKSSTSGWLGPALGAELQLGWFQLGLHAVAPLWPSQATYHADATLGVGFDL